MEENKEFLQSEEWRRFQEAVGRRTFFVSSQKSPSSPLASIRRSGPFEKGEDLFGASIIEHKLPIVGKYFYIPRGIIFNFQFSIFNQAPIFNDQIKEFFSELIDFAKREKAGWIRFDANNSETLDNIRKYLRVIKAPHDMQPREVFMIDITKPEEELLAEMKAKTRYNINLAEKKNIKVIKACNNCHPELVSGSSNNTEMLNQVQHDSSYYLDEFLRLVKLTSERQGITSHPEEYYRKMFEVIPAGNIKLYVAEYENKVIAANVVIFYNDTAIYLHGASDNAYRNVMAPYLLQWRAIQDAKKLGFKKYDFGGIKTVERSDLTPTLSLLRRGSKGEVNSWTGITKFKTGFSPNTKPTEFAGSYDIVLNRKRYLLYRVIQKIKTLLNV